AFIIGYLQGTVRRLLGIASVIFALVLSAQLRGPVGDFLTRNWTQFPSEYSEMIGWGLTFLVLWIAFGIAIQIYYERSKILPRYPWVDPILGGILGVVEGGILVGILVMIMDSYFRGAGLVVNPAEFLTLRDLDHAIDVSFTAQIYRETFIPAFLFLIGALIPEDVRKLFPPHS